MSKYVMAEDRTDYDLQRKLIEINQRYERGELTYREWIEARTKAREGI